MTWRPPLTESGKVMSESAADKQAEKEAVLFEERVRNGVMTVDGKTKFADYAAQWMESAQIAPKTRLRYIQLLKRINAAIGHVRLEKLQAHHLESFYKSLAENGIKESGNYAVSVKLKGIMAKRKLKTDTLAKQAGVASATVRAARENRHISIKKAENIAADLGLKLESVFKVHNNTTGLSDRTILHHHRLISSILEKAKRNRIVQYNVASEHADSPKVKRKEATYLTDKEAQKIVALLLDEEDIRAKTAILLLLYSGVRRGELCGLEWRDIDFEKQIIQINRASQYQPRIGIVEVPTKTEQSARSIKLPKIVFSVLAEYRSWWLDEKQKMRDRWKGDTERLFIKYDGSPINPDTINYWIEKFIKKHDLPHFTPHSCRHTFATLQIASGVDIRTLQARTGHSQASTLVNTYSHAIKSAAEAASDVLDNILTPKNGASIG